MNKMLTTLAAGLLLILMVSPVLALGPVNLEADAGIYSKYVWRGLIVTDDPVAQAGVSGSLMGMGFGIWGNMDLTDVNANSREFNEIDYTFTYGIGLPIVSVDVGLIYYDFPNSNIDGTGEFFASARSGLLFSPTLSVYYDFKEIKGGYIRAEASHGVPINTIFDFEIGVAVGNGTADYAKGYYGHNKSGLTDYQITASLPLKMFPLVSIKPAISYTNLLGESNDAAVDDSDALVLGVSASFKF